MWFQLMLPFKLPLFRSPKAATYWERYQAYLRSPMWQRVRKQTLELADYECQGRFPGCTEIATTAHHVSYLCWNGSGDRPGETTRAVCPQCHHYAHSHSTLWFDPAANDNLVALYRRRKSG